MYSKICKGLFFSQPQKQHHHTDLPFSCHFFCVAVSNGSHILSWMCLKGLILILHLSSVGRQIHPQTINWFETEHPSDRVRYESRV